MYHQKYNSIGSHIYNGIVYTDFEYLTPVFHNSYKLLYVIEGTINVNVNAMEITLSKGEAILIAPNIIHYWQKTGKNKHYCGVFSSDFVSEFFKKTTLTTFVKFCLSPDVEAFLSKNLFHTGTPEFYMLKGCLYIICSQCILAENNDEIAVSGSKFIQDVNTYISQNLDSNFSQKELAKALNYEYHHFSTLFNKIFRMGLVKYVNNLRYNSACRLLSTTDLKISQIANDCDFTSIRSFNRIFKEHSGLTPNEYRHSVNLTNVPEAVLPSYEKYSEN